MAVSETGASVGFISGGCVEAALTVEAQRAITEQKPLVTRYGEGSPYLDIELPCGSAIDLFVDPLIGDSVLEEILAAHEARRPIKLITDMTNGTSSVAPAAEREFADQLVRGGEVFERVYLPQIRVVACGKGPVVAALTALAAQAGLAVTTYSPDEADGSMGDRWVTETRPVLPGKGIKPADLDPWTAVAILFHEHELEFAYLETALASPCFYIGAMGSPTTHAKRSHRLAACGYDDSALARISAPIGLSIGSKSPPEIAVSILAEIIQAWHRAPEP